MTARVSRLLFIATCLAAGAAGGLLGYAFQNKPPSRRPREAETILRTLIETPPTPANSGTPFERALALLESAIFFPTTLAQTAPSSPSSAAALAATMAGRDPALFLTWLERDAGSPRPALADAARLFFAAWLARDFDDAVRGVGELPKGASRRAGLELAMELLCARDAPEIADFLRSNASDLSVTAGLRQWIKMRPREATAFAATLPASRLRMGLYLAAANEWADRDPPALLKWSAEQKGMDTGMAATPAFEKWASKDPAGLAAAWPQFSSAQRKASACEVARGLTAQDPHAALTWVMANTNGFLRYGALRSVFGAWSRSDLPAAAAAALTLPGGTSQQAAAEMLTDDLVKSDPAAAHTWAAQLAPGSARESALQRLPKETEGEK